jgi:glycosyltransferase involved in cell wall biosynthesis
LEQDVERVLVVDDGSTDATGGVLEDIDVEVIVHRENLGKGFALSSGFRRALELGAKRVITIDADGQHRPEDIPRLEAMSRMHPGAIVIAARLRDRDKAPRLRRFANEVADFWISWAGGQRIRDSQSGFRLYPAGVLTEVPTHERKGKGFVFESEILIDASHWGAEFRFVPIDTCYDVSVRSSYYKPWRDTWGIISMVAGHLLKKGMYPTGLLRSLGLLAPSNSHRNVSSHLPR